MYFRYPRVRILTHTLPAGKISYPYPYPQVKFPRVKLPSLSTTLTMACGLLCSLQGPPPPCGPASSFRAQVLAGTPAPGSVSRPRLGLGHLSCTRGPHRYCQRASARTSHPLPACAVRAAGEQLDKWCGNRKEKERSEGTLVFSHCSKEVSYFLLFF